MHYNKIRLLQEREKVSNRKIARAIGMSDVGYAKMLEKESCDVTTIEAIANFFKLPVSYFFDVEIEKAQTKKTLREDNTRITECIECKEKQKRIEEQKEEIRKLRNEKEILKDELLDCYRRSDNNAKNCG